jgi:hypothetical protein
MSPSLLQLSQPTGRFRLPIGSGRMCTSMKPCMCIRLVAVHNVGYHARSSSRLAELREPPPPLTGLGPLMGAKKSKVAWKMSARVVIGEAALAKPHRSPHDVIRAFSPGQRAAAPGPSQWFRARTRTKSPPAERTPGDGNGSCCADVWVCRQCNTHLARNAYISSVGRWVSWDMLFISDCIQVHNSPDRLPWCGTSSPLASRNPVPTAVSLRGGCQSLPPCADWMPQKTLGLLSPLEGALVNVLLYMRVLGVRPQGVGTSVLLVIRPFGKQAPLESPASCRRYSA